MRSPLPKGEGPGVGENTPSNTFQKLCDVISPSGEGQDKEPFSPLPKGEGLGVGENAIDAYFSK